MIGQDPALHPVLRRWDHKPTVAGEHALPIVEGVWIDLRTVFRCASSPVASTVRRLLADSGAYDHRRRGVAAR